MMLSYFFVIAWTTQLYNRSALPKWNFHLSILCASKKKIKFIPQSQTMNLGSIVKASFFASAIFSFIGAFLKITHREGADLFLIPGIITSLVFIATAIYEVRSSQRISHGEKTMWTIAFLFFNGFTGLIYMFISRKRIAWSIYKCFIYECGVVHHSSIGFRMASRFRSWAFSFFCSNRYSEKHSLLH